MRLQEISQRGKPAGPVRESCGKTVLREDLSAEQSPKYRKEREAGWETFKASR
jgi:hypothetical protein